MGDRSMIFKQNSFLNIQQLLIKYLYYHSHDLSLNYIYGKEDLLLYLFYGHDLQKNIFFEKFVDYQLHKLHSNYFEISILNYTFQVLIHKGFLKHIYDFFGIFLYIFFMIHISFLFMFFIKI